MRMGFTGTRHGMTDAQKAAFRDLIQRLKPYEFHHGSCQGADVEAARVVNDVWVSLIEQKWAIDDGALRIICHPGPDGDPHRQLSNVDDVTHPPKTHFVRNRGIVDATDILVACPCDCSVMSHGGTWYTVNYARKRGKPVYIVWPNGTIE